MKLSLEFAASGEPTHVDCRHFYSNGRQCKMSKAFTNATKAQVLNAKLRDSAEGDLVGVGLTDLGA